MDLIPGQVPANVAGVAKKKKKRRRRKRKKKEIKEKKWDIP